MIYLPQSDVQDYPIGRTVKLHVNPINAKVECEVQRIALETQRAPESLARYYRTNESLMPVYLRVKDANLASNVFTAGFKTS